MTLTILLTFVAPKTLEAFPIQECRDRSGADRFGMLPGLPEKERAYDYFRHFLKICE
jgi:hypothetical protein